jgi:putative transposase
MKILEGQVPVAYMCRYFDVSKSGYYSWLKGASVLRRSRQEFLRREIKRLFNISRETYGSPRIYQDLSRKGHFCSENTVAKMMKAMGLTADLKKKYKVATTDSNHANPIAPRVFKVEDENPPRSPKEIWAADITYISLDKKFVYLSVVLDIGTRKVVGWSLDDSLNSGGVIKAMEMAFTHEGDKAGIICHSDRGVQYASQAYRNLLDAKEAIPSMSRKGNCYDNAFVESFFKTFKSEFIYRQKFSSLRELKSGIFEYIETWYNRKRLHSALDYLSPVEYELKIKSAA